MTKIPELTITAPLTEKNKAALCQALDSQIPKLVDDLNDADAVIDKTTCLKLRQSVGDDKNPAYGLFNGLIMNDLSCEDDKEKINYGLLREVYNKLIARKALLDELAPFLLWKSTSLVALPHMIVSDC